jgi:DNA polymerase elongation subunit (family B)
LKILKKVKTRYLAEKALETDTPVEKLVLTDEDLVPMEMLDWVLTQMEHKHSEKVQSLN